MRITKWEDFHKFKLPLVNTLFGGFSSFPCITNLASIEKSNFSNATNPIFISLFESITNWELFLDYEADKSTSCHAHGYHPIGLYETLDIVCIESTTYS